MTNAQELFHQDGASAGVYHCNECRLIYCDRAEAERCCACVECGAVPRAPHRSTCARCKAKNEIAAAQERERRTQEMWEAAPKVGVVPEGCMVYDKDADEWIAEDDLVGYLEALKHEAAEDGGELTLPRIYIATPHKGSLSAEEIVDHMCDDMHEEARDGIPDSAIDLFQRFLTRWCRLYAPTTYYDQGTALELDLYIAAASFDKANDFNMRCNVGDRVMHGEEELRTTGEAFARTITSAVVRLSSGALVNVDTVTVLGHPVRCEDCGADAHWEHDHVVNCDCGAHVCSGCSETVDGESYCRDCAPGAAAAAAVLERK